MTYKDVCEFIVETEKILDPETKVTWKDVWFYSPTGELYMIIEWYEQAKALREYMSTLNSEQLSLFIQKCIDSNKKSVVE